MSFNLSNVGKIFWVKSERAVSKCRKRKFWRCAHLLLKTGVLNEEVSCRSRATTAKKCTKKRDARAKFFFFVNLNLFAGRSRRCKNSLLL